MLNTRNSLQRISQPAINTEKERLIKFSFITCQAGTTAAIV